MKIDHIVLTALLAIVTCSGLTAAPGYFNKLYGFTFTTAIEFSAPVKAGLDALLISYPKVAKPGTETMSITAVRFPPEAIGAGGMSDVELLEYVKTSFLATSGAGLPVERTFLSHLIKGEALKKSIPVPSRVEIYVVPLKSGEKVVIGFVFTPEFSAQAGPVIAEVASSLRE
jgi:hypothetical protein